MQGGFGQGEQDEFLSPDRELTTGIGTHESSRLSLTCLPTGFRARNWCVGLAHQFAWRYCSWARRPLSLSRWFPADEEISGQIPEFMLSSVMALHCPDSMSAVADFFNEMTPAKLERLGDIYGPGVEFQDPIHDAHGLSKLRDVLSNRFKEMVAARVTVLDAHGDDRTGFLLWTTTYQHHGTERVIHGTSHFKFANDGRISAQRDHWDASFVLYGELPVLGWVMRIIKRRAQMIPEKSGT